MDLDKLLEGLDADEAKAKKDAIDQMILGIRNTCIVPGDMSDNDIKAIFEPFLTDEYLDQFEDENDLFNDILPKILTALTSRGIKIKFN